VSQTTEEYQCWNCGEHSPSQRRAIAVLPVLQLPPGAFADYYRFFSLPKTLAIDDEVLQHTFYPDDGF